MSQENNILTNTKRSKYIVLATIVIAIIVIAAAVALFSMRNQQTSKPVPLSISPYTTAVQTVAGQSLTFNPGIPEGAKFTKLVWNFGNGYSETITSGNGIVNYTYEIPGSYLVSLQVFNSTTSISNNQSLLLVTVIPSLNVNPASIFGPISITSTSTGYDNQTIPVGGWVNMSFGGLLSPTPENIGSPVPNDNAYHISAFTWDIDNGMKVINNTNVNMNGTINVTFTNPGINFVELNVTTSGPNGNVFGTYEVTIAVGNYSVMKIVPKIAPNRNELIDAAYLPGGPATFDPALTSDVVSQEVTFEIYQGLLMNTNNSINTYVPVIAKNIPSIQNGEEQVSPNGFVNFTFYINTSIQFSNGDHVSPYDVYVSFARDLLFANDPGSPDWGLASLMLPAPSIFGPFNNSFYWIHRAITWNNATDSVTFHLLPAAPTWLPNVSAIYANQSYGNLNQSFPVTSWGGIPNFLQGLTLETDGGGITPAIMDWKWLVEHGGFPANNSAAYANFSNPVSGPGAPGMQNTYIQYHAMGTGPYQLSLYEPAQEVVLTVNPYYHWTIGMPHKSKLIPEVIIEYLTNQATAIQQLESGQAQFADGAISISDTSLALKLEKEGIIGMEFGTDIALNFFAFNFDFNLSGAQQYLSSTNIPPTFFANLSVRKAFTYAFNESYWINVANSNSGISYMSNLSGVIPAGVIGYSPNLPSYQFNLTLAKKYWDQTNYSKTGRTYVVPLFNWIGNPSVDEMYAEYAKDLSLMSNGQIQAQTVDVSFLTLLGFTNYGAGGDPMPIYFLGWSGGDAAVFTGVFLTEYGFQPYTDGITPPSAFNATSYPDQWQNFTKMWNLLNLAMSTYNVTLSDQYYYEAQLIALNLYMYFGTSQPKAVLIYSTEINPSTLQLTMLNGATDIYFYDVQYV